MFIHKLIFFLRMINIFYIRILMFWISHWISFIFFILYIYIYTFFLILFTNADLYFRHYRVSRLKNVQISRHRSINQSLYRETQQEIISLGNFLHLKKKNKGEKKQAVLTSNFYFFVFKITQLILLKKILLKKLNLLTT